MSTAGELYEQAEKVLQSAWDEAKGTAGDVAFPDLRERVEKVVTSPDVGHRYALPTQLLLKATRPELDALGLADWPEAPGGFSARSLCRNVVVPFNATLAGPLGMSQDPYVSQPLRVSRLSREAVSRNRQPDRWLALLDILEHVEASPQDAPGLLADVLRVVAGRRLTLPAMVDGMLALQSDQRDDDDWQEQRRDLLVTRGVPLITTVLEALGLEGSLRAEASVGKGSPAEVPWLRVFSPEHAPAATNGVYLVYLFAADGSAAYLAIVHGVEERTAGDLPGLAQRSLATLTEQGVELPTPAAVDLGSERSRPRSYERAVVTAMRYEAGAVPADEDLREDLRSMATALKVLYDREAAAHGVEGGQLAVAAATAELADLSRLDLEGIERALDERGLFLPPGVMETSLAALRAGKHLLLTGPPGTGKTSFAEVLAHAATLAGAAHGWHLTTATADWTSAETMGSYRLRRDQELEFRPGEVLQAVEAGQWLVIDELNRADADKAFGQLLTVLSGQAVRLPFEVEGQDGHLAPVMVSPPGAPTLPGAKTYRVPSSWRVIATMNSQDRDLLFRLSHALLRRFAVIEVPPPPPSEYDRLLSSKGSVDAGGPLDRGVRALTRLPGGPLGPAMVLDAMEFLRERLAMEGAGQAIDHDRLLEEALTAFVLPQLAELSQAALTRVADHLHRSYFSARSRGDVMQLVESVVGVPLDAASALGQLGDEDDELAD